MTYRGYPMWPPIWVGVGATRGKNPEGEAGRLVTLRRYPNKPQRIFLVMEYEGDQYTGCLLFDNNALCDQAYDFLIRRCGMLIEAIGSLNVPLDLASSYYRKASGYQTWHFNADCSHWPGDDYEDQAGPPPIGQLCNECKAR